LPQDAQSEKPQNMITNARPVKLMTARNEQV